MDPFFPYIPFLSHTKKCLGMNTNLRLVAVVVRSVADLAYHFGSNRVASDSVINHSNKSILLYYVYFVALIPIPQVNNRTINLWAFLFKNCNFLLCYFRCFFLISPFWEDTRFGIWAFSVSMEQDLYSSSNRVNNWKPGYPSSHLNGLTP